MKNRVDCNTQPLVTSLTLYFVSTPSLFLFFVNTHLFAIGTAPTGLSTSSHVPIRWSCSSLVWIAFFHSSQSEEVRTSFKLWQSLSQAKLAPTRNAFPNDPRTYATSTSRVITAPNPSSNQVISRTRDRGNLSHDLSHDLSRDLPVPNVSRDLTARDLGKIAHDQPRNWSSSTSQDPTRFGYATRPLINTWKTVGRIHKHVTVDQSTKTRLIGVTPQ